MDRDAIRFEHNSHPGKLKVANLAALKKFLYGKSRPVGRNVSSILLESRRISGAVASRSIARWKLTGASTRSNPPSRSASLRVQASGRLRYRRAAPADKHAGAGHKLGFDPQTMPMKPTSVEQCISEGLNALRKNRSRIVPGRLNRFMDAFVPVFVKRTFTVKMLGKALAKTEAANARAQGAGSPAPCRSSF